MREHRTVWKMATPCSPLVEFAKLRSWFLENTSVSRKECDELANH